ncbi:MAG: Holo-[acyl-carrier-protein] synthase [Parcubacteria group bacterium GW2011_GWA2_47_7]|nr:MAG: Holo-[acyl-carrier-protein] synthase [Parcubacteria group bacterium GW2011_GWA2_47_7]
MRDDSKIKLGVTGVGVDIIEIHRFGSLCFPSRIAELVLTPIEYVEFLNHANRVMYLASRFAAKEAVIKAYPSVLTYRDIEITKDGKKPRARILSGGATHPSVLVSISHSTDYVAGFALAL